MLNFIKNNKQLYKVGKKIQRFLTSCYWSPLIIYSLVRNASRHDVVLCECFIMHSGYKFKKNNWGDDINKYFFEFVTGKRFISIPYKYMSLRPLLHYSLIGSILGFHNLDNTIVYGSGLIRPDIEIHGTPREIISVRGPKTQQILLEKGMQCPRHYGDPALLLPLFYTPRTLTKKQIVIIPNMGTDDNVVRGWIAKSHITNYKIINLTKYDDWRSIIDDITNCGYVISESLHGLIVAETYGIPNVWVEFVEHPNYWNFKYEDFYESIGKNETIIRIQENADLNVIQEKSKSWKKARIEYKRMLSYFPFEINCIINQNVLAEGND